MRWIFGALVLFACACGGTTDNGDAGNKKDAAGTDVEIGDASARVPLNHRPASVTCPTGRGTEDGQWGDAGGPPGTCSRDSDCTAGTNGRCIVSGFGAQQLACSYDACASDTDCAGTACVCRSSATDTRPNVCGSSQSDCRVDSDCGPNGYCSPTESSGSYCYGTLTMFACHTPQDECIDDADCVAEGACNYDTTLKRWKCGHLCAPPPP
jgi:hypothetical protein